MKKILSIFVVVILASAVIFYIRINREYKIQEYMNLSTSYFNEATHELKMRNRKASDSLAAIATEYKRKGDSVLAERNN